MTGAEFSGTDVTHFVGELDNRHHQEEAALYMIDDGLPTAVYNGTVYGLWGNGNDPRFFERMLDVKGRSADAAVALTLDSASFGELVATDKLDAHAEALIKNPAELAERLGGIAFVRCAAREDQVLSHDLPKNVISHHRTQGLVVQNYDPYGKEGLASFLHLAEQRAQQQGLEFLPVVTSLNASGDPEIIAPEQAKQFVEHHKLPLLDAEAPPERATGSYSIVEFDDTGVHIVRPGSVSTEVLELLLDTEITPSSSMRERKPGFRAFGIEDLPQNHQELPLAALRQLVLEGIR
jgi:tRNA A37 threonylcarbamoyladenosine synthetase subunit TsaC/SUA5/YrdC